MTPEAVAGPDTHGDGERLAPLVVRAQAGDTAAFEALVVRFQDMAVGYAYALLRDRELARDAAQEAFAEAYTSLPGLREPAAFPGWFRRVVFKHCDRLTRRARLRVVPLDQALELPTSLQSPAEVAEAVEERAAIRREVLNLPEPERTATALHYIGEYTQAEIAAFLDVPVTTVNNRVHAARKRLQRSLMSMVQDNLRETRPSRDGEFVAGVLRLIAPREERDSARILETLEGKTVSGRSEWRDGRLAHSHFDWAVSRVGLAGDRVVSIFGVYDVTMRVGSARVRAAGVNLEYTDRDYPDESLSHQTATASVEAMAAAEYDLSVAFGNESLYVGLGYVTAWRELMWFIRTGDLPEGPPGFTIEQFDPVHREELAALYNAEHEGLTGTVVRPTYRRNKHPGANKGYLWRGPGKRVRGYVVADPTHEWRSPDLGRLNHGGHRDLLWHDESAGDVGERLAVLGHFAREAGCAEVGFDRLHRRSPLGKRLSGMRCRIEEEYRSYVVRIINLERLFQKLAPELTRRLAGSELAGWTGTLLVGAGEQQVLLRIGADDVDVVPGNTRRRPEDGSISGAIEGGAEMARLVVGSDEPWQIVEAAEIRVHGEASRLLPVLFPRQDPQMENQAL